MFCLVFKYEMLSFIIEKKNSCRFLLYLKMVNIVNWIVSLRFYPIIGRKSKPEKMSQSL